MVQYIRPLEFNEALAALASKDDWLVMAGGTDIYPAHVERPINDDILDITALKALNGISKVGTSIRFGATTTWSDIIDHPLPKMFDALKQSAMEIGGRQIQNAGTIGGNICNASPAADGTAVLIAMDACVELVSVNGARRMPLEQFVISNRHTAKRSNELLTSIYVKHCSRSVSNFKKLGTRRFLVISIVMVTVVLELSKTGYIENARISIGSCAPVAMRLERLEDRLRGRGCDDEVIEFVDAECFSHLQPIDDIRGTALFRADVAIELTRRCLTEAISKASDVH